MVTFHYLGQNGDTGDWKHNCRKGFVLEIGARDIRKGVSLKLSKKGEREGREANWYQGYWLKQK